MTVGMGALSCNARQRGKMLHKCFLAASPAMRVVGGGIAVGAQPSLFWEQRKEMHFFTSAQSRLALVGFDNYLGRPRRVPWSCWDEQKRKVFPYNERFLAYLAPLIFDCL